MNKHLSNIEVLKKHNEPLNQKKLLHLPTNTPFGNLNLKWLDVVQRFDSVNDLINTVDLYFVIVKDTYPDQQGANVHTYLLPRERFATEQIFYWIKKSADELISLLYVLEYNNANGDYPTEIKIDCIGRWIAEPNKQID